MENNLNITPEMINNLANMLKNSKDSSSNNSNIEQSSSTNLNKILSNLSQDTNYSDSTSKKDSDSQTIDMDTILKIKSIMETLNQKNDSKSNLLYSLKPYLRKSKQDKLEQYINIMKLSQVTNLFK